MAERSAGHHPGMADPNDESRPVRVALSNDYEIALLGLAAMLAQFPDQVQVVDLTTESTMPHHPDIILFDTFGRLPEEDVKLRKTIASNTAKVIVYSSVEDYPEEAAKREGAAGYLSKSLGAADLVAAIVALHRDEQPPAASDGSAPDLTWPGQVSGLSAREAEMMSFLVRGLSNHEIAARAYLSVNTVKTYIRTAYRKIGARNRAQAVVWGLRHGFESTDDTGV